MAVTEQQDTEMEPDHEQPETPTELKRPRCWPVRPHVRRGNKLYCATCGELIMTLLN